MIDLTKLAPERMTETELLSEHRRLRMKAEKSKRESVWDMIRRHDIERNIDKIQKLKSKN